MISTSPAEGRKPDPQTDPLDDDDIGWEITMWDEELAALVNALRRRKMTPGSPLANIYEVLCDLHHHAVESKC